jgi:hypothetical protein
VKVAARIERTHHPGGEAHGVSGLRENLTSRSDGEGLETEPWDRLRHRHEAKAAGKRPLPGPNATAPVLYPTVDAQLDASFPASPRSRVPGMFMPLEGASPSANLMAVKAREAQGRHREVGSEGSVYQRGEPTNRNWIGGVAAGRVSVRSRSP